VRLHEQGNAQVTQTRLGCSGSEPGADLFLCRTKGSSAFAGLAVCPPNVGRLRCTAGLRRRRAVPPHCAIANTSERRLCTRRPTHQEPRRVPCRASGAGLLRGARAVRCRAYHDLARFAWSHQETVCHPGVSLRLRLDQATDESRRLWAAEAMHDRSNVGPAAVRRREALPRGAGASAVDGEPAHFLPVRGCPAARHAVDHRATGQGHCRPRTPLLHGHHLPRADLLRPRLSGSRHGLLPQQVRQQHEHGLRAERAQLPLQHPGAAAAWLRRAGCLPLGGMADRRLAEKEGDGRCVGVGPARRADAQAVRLDAKQHRESPRHVHDRIGRCVIFRRTRASL
jgi:hypothetical protein